MINISPHFVEEEEEGEMAVVEEDDDAGIKTTLSRNSGDVSEEEVEEKDRHCVNPISIYPLTSYSVSSSSSDEYEYASAKGEENVRLSRVSYSATASLASWRLRVS